MTRGGHYLLASRVTDHVPPHVRPTAEIRWFLRGALPEGAVRWFEAAAGARDWEARTDRYVRTAFACLEDL